MRWLSSRWRSALPLIALIGMSPVARADAAAPTKRFSGTGQLSIVADAPGPRRYVVEHNDHITPVAPRAGMRDDVGATVTMHDGRVVAAAPADVTQTETPGTVRTLGILVAMPGEAAHPITADQFASALRGAATSADAFYSAQSGGDVRIQPTVVPAWVPAGNDASCLGDDESALTDEALAGARGQGYDPDAYDRVVIYMNGCRTGGADLGYGDMPGRFVWLLTPPDEYLAGTIAHELGHTFGANHASSLDCYDDDGNRVAFSDACGSTEYGDPFDSMGYAQTGPVPLFSTWHRADTRQLAGSLETVESGTVNLDDATTAGQTLVVVPRRSAGEPARTWWALELRAPDPPFDAFSAFDPVVTGVTIRLVGPLGQQQMTNLIDTHPATTTFADAPLQPGETFTDAAHSTTITLDSVDAGRAVLSIRTPLTADTTPPPAPVAWGSRSSDTSVELNWLAVQDDDSPVVNYDILRDGVHVSSTAASSISLQDDGGHHVYGVEAVDGSGNASQPATVDIAGPPPTPPGDITARQTGSAVVLTWTASTGRYPIARYDVAVDGTQRGSTSGTSYSITPSHLGWTTYGVTAVSTDGASSLEAVVALYVLGDTAPAGPGTGAPGPSGSGAITSGTPPPTVTPVENGGSGKARHPKLKLRSPKLRRGTAKLGKRRRLRFTATEPGSAVSIRIRIGSRTVRAHAIKLTRGQARRSTVVVTATDAAGHSTRLRLRLRKSHIRLVRH